MRAPRVIVVVKRTSFEQLLAQHGEAHVARLHRAADPLIARTQRTHDEHRATVAAVSRALEAHGAEAAWLSRDDGHAFARKLDLVITVGGDGTLLAASRHVGKVPILGVNSAPSTSVGFFCATDRDGVDGAIARALAGRLHKVTLARMEVRRNGKVVARRVLNEALVCHASPAATSRYVLTWGAVTEEQKSSGFWIGPAAGSTAAQRSAGGEILPLTSRRLQLVVREPYTPASAPLRFTHLLVPDGRAVSVRSKMKEARMFLDGPHDPIDVGFGDELVFRRSAESLDVLGLRARRGWASDG